jgi:hypothetical protein
MGDPIKIVLIKLLRVRNYLSAYFLRYSNGLIPVFLDCMSVAISPASTDASPTFDGDRSNQMQFSCMNRHVGHINGLFLDWSAPKIGLKQLWILKWHRHFDTTGSWTAAGNVQPQDWPDWMSSFKNY